MDLFRNHENEMLHSITNQKGFIEYETTISEHHIPEC